MQNTTGTAPSTVKSTKSLIKSTRVKVYPRSLALFAILALMFFFEVYSYGSYLDEGLTIVAMVIIAFRIRKISSTDLITLGLFFSAIALGLFSNFFYGVNSSPFSVFTDAVTQCKFVSMFFAVRYSLTEKERAALAEMLCPIARIFFLLAASFAVISLFTDIDMSGQERYGIKTFNFIFKFNFQYTSISFLMFGSIVNSKTLPDRKKHFYYIVGCISILAALKAPGLIFPLMFVSLFFYFKKYQHINVPFALVIVLAGIAISSFQIETYLLNETAPRRLFFDYSIVTAKHYFPLGSGFGTFGSAEAAKNYSQLYYQYGFNKMFGMSPTNRAFLSDTYWPCAIGQLGFFGGAMFFIVFIRIFFTFSSGKSDHSKRAYLYAVYFTFMIHAIGSSIFTNSAGLLGLMSLAIFAPTKEEMEYKKKRLRIHISI